MDIARLLHEARRVREAIEQAPVEARPITLSSFPNGSCGDTTLILGTYLAEQCAFPVFDYVCGERGEIDDNSWTSHAWLQRGDVIVDITADQFDDAPGSVIVEEGSLWHQQFQTEVLHPATLKAVHGPSVDDLLRLYSRICRALATDPQSDARMPGHQARIVLAGESLRPDPRVEGHTNMERHMARSSPPPQQVPVTTEVNGKTHKGTYELSGGVITVRTANGSKSTQVGGSPPDSLARMMLGELVREGKH